MWREGWMRQVIGHGRKPRLRSAGARFSRREFDRDSVPRRVILDGLTHEATAENDIEQPSHADFSPHSNSITHN